jgi:predicted dehydrogenase
MMPTRLRMGVVGCGAISQIMHIPHIVDYDDYFELVALADAYQPVLEAVADRYHVQPRYTDWRELMARNDIDAVVIAHSGSHRDTVIGALDAGKHVFCEKPLAWNVREVNEVAARAAASDRIVQMGYHKLYDPAFFYTKEHVDKMRDLGFVRITVLHPTNELGFSPYRIRRGNGLIVEGHVDPGTWEDQLRAQLQGVAGGDLAPLMDEILGERKGNAHLRLAAGIVLQSLIHQIYMMFGFLGEPARVVHASQWREGESIHALVEYPNNVRCSLDWHYLSHLKDYREEYLFCGNFDRVALQFPSPYFRNFPSPVIVQGGEGELAWERRVIVSHEEAFRNEMLAFHDNVVNNRQPRTSVQDAVRHARFTQSLIDTMQ